MFTVTGTTVNNGVGGSPLTAAITVTAVKTGTLNGIVITPVSSTINQGDTTQINVRLTYTNGSYVNNAPSSMYSLSITSGATYGSLSGNVLTGLTFSGTNNQTVTIHGIATENTALTSDCTVTVKALTVPGAHPRWSPRKRKTARCS